MRSGRVLRRMLKVAFAVAVVVTGLIAAQGSATATMLVVAGLMVAGVALWWRRQREAATSVLALVLTCLTTGYITEWAAGVAGTGLGQTTGLAFWAFAGAVTIASWTVRRHTGSRGVTVVLANAALVVLSPLTALAPETGVLLAFVVAMGVVAWRGGGWLAVQRWWWRRRPVEPSDGDADPVAPRSIAENVRGTNRTARAVAQLSDAWRVLGGRQLTPKGPAIEHVLLGPAQTLLIYTRAWSGRVELLPSSDGDSTPRYGFDGDPSQLVERLRPIVAEASQAQLRLDEGSDALWSVIVFWDATKLPGRWLEFDILDERDPAREPARVVLVRGEHLNRWIDDLPAPDADDLERRFRIAARMLGPMVHRPA